MRRMLNWIQHRQGFGEPTEASGREEGYGSGQGTWELYPEYGYPGERFYPGVGILLRRPVLVLGQE